MDEEMLRIQKMVAEGKVTPEESVELLESLGVQGAPTADGEAAGKEPAKRAGDPARTIKVSVDVRHVVGMICGAAIAIGGGWMVMKYGEGSIRALMLLAPMAMGALVAVGSVSACKTGKKD